MFRHHTYALLLVVLFSASGCELLSFNARSGGDEKVVSLANPVEVGYGDTVEIEETGLRLRFYEVEESRCPTDVTCVWEGEAKVFLEAERGGQEISVKLTIPGRVNASTGNGPEAEVLGHRVKLVKLTPHPEQGRDTRKQHYNATLEVAPLS